MRATEYRTIPLPRPDSPDVIVIHAASLAAVHEQVSSDAVTLMLPVPPPASTVADDGEIVNVHTAAAACVMVNVCPPALMVPVREGPAFCATLKLTLPLPERAPVWLTVIHAAFDTALQVQDEAEAVTANVPVPPGAAIVWLDGDTVNEHGAGSAADCVTVNVWPAIVTVPARALDDPFAVHATVMRPLPVPESGSVASHSAADEAAQVHEA